jgi:putative ABC transport system permease protein
MINEGTLKLEVVGVVKHIKHLSWDADEQSKIRFQMYTDYNQIPDQFFADATGTMSLVVRSKSDSAELIRMVREQVSAIDRDQPIYNVKRMDELIASTISERRFAMILLAAFACVAMILAAVGIYGVMSYSVAQRSYEMGIRVALGAQGRDVLTLVVGQGLKLVLAGVAIGLAGAFALTRVISALLFGVSATDPVTFVATSALLTGVALAASFIPAHRATRVDPMVALRYK